MPDIQILIGSGYNINILYNNHLDMKTGKLLTQLFYLLLFLVPVINVEAQEKYYIRMSLSEIRRNPESWMIDFSSNPRWGYCHGLVLQAILQTGQKTGDTRYFDYVYNYADTMINNQGLIADYQIEEYNIDRLNPGKILFPLYAITKEERFKKALDLLRSQINSHPRTAEGSFWHKKIYPHQVWLDGLYMACPFLAQYASTFNEPELFDDVANQIINISKHSYDPKTGLYYHGWDESRLQKWADPVTGLSQSFWSRSIGWYMMAIVDALDYIPENHPKRSEIVSILRNLCASVARYRDPETGMWYQVTDQLGRQGNYLESTGSAMFIYTWIKGAQKGYLDKKFEEMGKKAYKQYVKRFIITEPDGSISVTDGCSVAGLGGTTQYRDGSFDYYISEPIRNNDPKAVGPFIMVSLLLNK